MDVKLGIPAEELISIIGEYDALVVRSETKVTAAVIEAARKLEVIGRAGAGVDNIDVEAATQRGIIVVNAPLGNSHLGRRAHDRPDAGAVAAHSAGQCHPQGAASGSASGFMGVEVRGKTLGIIGLGQIGSEVARRARGLEMHVIACDPFVSQERAQVAGVEIV